MNDRSIIQSTIAEVLPISGFSVVVSPALGMLQRLANHYGEKVTVEGACHALNELAKTSLQLRRDLLSRQLKNNGYHEVVILSVLKDDACIEIIPEKSDHAAFVFSAKELTEKNIDPSKLSKGSKFYFKGSAHPTSVSDLQILD